MGMLPREIFYWHRAPKYTLTHTDVVNPRNRTEDIRCVECVYNKRMSAVVLGEKPWDFGKIGTHTSFWRIYDGVNGRAS